MDKNIQDISWACLPKEARNKIRKIYQREEYNYNHSGGSKAYYYERMKLIESIFGHHNLTSDTEPKEMLMVERKRVQEMYKQSIEESDKLELPRDYCVKYNVLMNLFGDKCIPDKPINGAIGTTPPAHKLDVKSDTPNPSNSGELKPQSVEGQPKFKVGDKVRIIIEGWQRDPISEVIYYDEGDNTYKLDALDCEEGGLWVKEWQIEPYTETETKDSDNRQALYDALCELESASKKVRKALIALNET